MPYSIVDDPTYRPKTAYPGFSGVGSGHRYYHPELSRWMSRDPIGEIGFRQLQLASSSGGLKMVQDLIDYVFVRNNPVTLIDVLGLLGYETQEGPKGKKCGDFHWNIKWTLDKSEITGYIVQEMEYRILFQECGKNTWSRETGHFWEAWEVTKGFFGQRISPNSYDSWDGENRGKCTIGSIWVRGTAAFFWTGDLPSTFVKGNRTVPESAETQYSSPVQPTFFGQLGGNYVVRKLIGYWDCCQGEKPTEIVVTP